MAVLTQINSQWVNGFVFSFRIFKFIRGGLYTQVKTRTHGPRPAREARARHYTYSALKLKAVKS
jgi:hypothetical protein